MSNNTSSSSGVGFLGLLVIMLIGLKITDNLEITWGTIVLITFSPLLIVLVALLVIMSWALITGRHKE